MMMLGDFNIDYNSKSKSSSSDRQKLRNFANCHSLDQLISSPTRITENAKYIIIKCVIEAGIPEKRMAPTEQLNIVHTRTTIKGFLSRIWKNRIDHLGICCKLDR